MKTRLLLSGLLALTFASGVAQAADDATQKLIQLDKQWGEAAVKGDAKAVAGLLADDLMAIDDQGVSGKAEQVKAVEPQAGPAYTAGDYKVTFVDAKTAVMTHTVAGPQPHRSFHVWAERGGAWKVVATVSIPNAK